MRRIPQSSLVVVALAFLVSPALAGQYPARSDTGWVYASKRECCNGALAMAQETSVAVCRNVGGVPRPMRGGVQRRGFCEWESTRDTSGEVLFRCRAEASVPCR